MCIPKLHAVVSFCIWNCSAEYVKKRKCVLSIVYKLLVTFECLLIYSTTSRTFVANPYLESYTTAFQKINTSTATAYTVIPPLSCFDARIQKNETNAFESVDV